MASEELPDPRNLEEIEAASKAKINELFAKDPVDLNDAEVARLIEEMRQVRGRFAAEDRTAKTQGRKVKTSKGIKKDTSMEDFLDLQVEGLDEILKKEYFGSDDNG